MRVERRLQVGRDGREALGAKRVAGTREDAEGGVDPPRRPEVLAGPGAGDRVPQRRLVLAPVEQVCRDRDGALQGQAAAPDPGPRRVGLDDGIERGERRAGEIERLGLGNLTKRPAQARPGGGASVCVQMLRGWRTPSINLSSGIKWTSTPRRPVERRGFRAPFANSCRMRIVTYRDLRAGRFAKPLERLRAALARGDFAAAGLKKLAPTPYWRAKLSDEARLLMQFVPYDRETVCLFLEVIAHHVHEKSHFLRGAPVDRDKIEAGPDDLTPQPESSVRLGWALRWLPPDAVEFELIDKPTVLGAAQDAVRRHAPPLVIIGPAGSGKTAVTLAKMREATGNVLWTKPLTR